jgi:uridine kinase
MKGLFIIIYLVSIFIYPKVEGFFLNNNNMKSTMFQNDQNGDIKNYVDHGDVIVIGIAGGSGSGKTTLAKAIYAAIGEDNCTYITHDSYYRDQSHLSQEESDKLNFDHPDTLETSLLIEHIKNLKNHLPVRIPTYDYATHSRLNGVEDLPSRPVVLVEGILIFSDPELLKLMDIKVYVDTDDDIRLIRRMQRDIVERGRSTESIISQYLETVRPMHHEFVEPSKRNADIIIPVGLNSVALDLVVSRLREVVDSDIKRKEKNQIVNNDSIKEL